MIGVLMWMSSNRTRIPLFERTESQILFIRSSEFLVGCSFFFDVVDDESRVEVVRETGGVAVAVRDMRTLPAFRSMGAHTQFMMRPSADFRTSAESWEMRWTRETCTGTVFVVLRSVMVVETDHKIRFICQAGS